MTCDLGPCGPGLVHGLAEAHFVELVCMCEACWLLSNLTNRVHTTVEVLVYIHPTCIDRYIRLLVANSVVIRLPGG